MSSIIKQFDYILANAVFQLAGLGTLSHLIRAHRFICLSTLFRYLKAVGSVTARRD